MEKLEKAIVVFSGGQDSTTCLFWAMEKFHAVEAVTFDYGQRHYEEIECARNICSELGIKHRVLDMSLLNQLADSALTRDIAISDDENNIPNTFVPGRNLLFISFVAVIAQMGGFRHIITGVCETDFSGYPDCRDMFVKSLNVTLNLAMDANIIVHTPLMWLNKEQTWKLADELGAFEFVREKTLTCYNGVIGNGCEQCPACALRNNGLNNYLASKEGGD